jgi:YHS domain-containing protein
MRRFLASAFAILFVLSVVAFIAPSTQAEPEKELKCPISGKPANADISLNVNGEKVAFCCENCPKAYKKKIGLVDKGPAKCGACDKEGNASTSIVHRKAEMVYFCCNNCPKAYAKKHEFTVKDDGPKKCPLRGKDAIADSSLIVNGETIYFCCQNCPKSYKKKLDVAEKKELVCPQSGKPGKEETGQIHVTSAVVYFCCESCRDGYVKKNFTKKDEKDTKPAAEKKDA